jgi:nicotinamidase-related amidase
VNGTRVKRSDCVLVVVDVQDRLIETIAEHAAVVQNIIALIKAAQTLQLPILATEQENLGETVPGLRALLPNPPTRKLTFSSCDSLEFMTKLNTIRKKTVAICGIETHICVSQTVLDLLHGHYRVLVISDATSSHALLDREAALRRMEMKGAEITTSEALIYELTEKAGTDEFRSILEIVKERRKTSETQSTEDKIHRHKFAHARRTRREEA